MNNISRNVTQKKVKFCKISKLLVHHYSTCMEGRDFRKKLTLFSCFNVQFIHFSKNFLRNSPVREEIHLEKNASAPSLQNSSTAAKNKIKQNRFPQFLRAGNKSVSLGCEKHCQCEITVINYKTISLSWHQTKRDDLVSHREAAVCCDLCIPILIRNKCVLTVWEDSLCPTETCLASTRHPESVWQGGIPKHDPMSTWESHYPVNGSTALQSLSLISSPTLPQRHVFHSRERGGSRVAVMKRWELSTIVPCFFPLASFLRSNERRGGLGEGEAWWTAGLSAGILRGIGAIFGLHQSFTCTIK